MTVVTLTSDYLVHKLSQIGPHSRLRPGIEAILQEIRRRELEFDADREFQRRLEAEIDALNDEHFQRSGGLAL